ncbi:hypothetical protein BLNAU_22267 [Blattamonas nauphoetae]|uniref:Uncharacterized protein n=1 Tax=Blattamonas nauphoetae TaxID=2049346 RepID=A0ABQ9WUK1_9EUKA|nr:hypothetical protein BLNAU_22267 [Blattamonas nauphoetae]
MSVHVDPQNQFTPQNYLDSGSVTGEVSSKPQFTSTGNEMRCSDDSFLSNNPFVQDQSKAQCDTTELSPSSLSSPEYIPSYHASWTFEKATPSTKPASGNPRLVVTRPNTTFPVEYLTPEINPTIEEPIFSLQDPLYQRPSHNVFPQLFDPICFDSPCLGAFHRDALDSLFNQDVTQSITGRSSGGQCPKVTTQN